MGNSVMHMPHELAASAITGRTSSTVVPLPSSFVDAINNNFKSIAPLFQFPGSAAYLANTVCWNYDALGSPSALFVPTAVSHIVALFALLAAHPLTAPHSLAIAGGRHSHHAFGDNTLVVDMSKFNATNINADKQTGTFGAGIKLGDFDQATIAHGLAVTGGTNPDTGIAGLVTGGGFGHLARRHGLTCDNLLSIRAVLPSGEVVHATLDNEHKDLLWATKGGGGNFGIITEFEFKLHKRGDVYAGAAVFITRAFTNVFSVLQQWREYNRTASRDVSCMAVMMAGGPMILLSAYVGDDIDGAEAALKQVRSIGSPMINSFSRQKYARVNIATDKIGADLQSSVIEHQPAGNYYESALTLVDLSDDALRVIIAHTASDAAPTKTCQIVLVALGGAITDASEVDSPIGFRNAGYMAMLFSSWKNCATKEEYTKERTKCQGWIRGIMKDLGQYSISAYNTLGDTALDAAKTSAAQAGAASASSASVASSSSPSTSPSFDSSAPVPFNPKSMCNWTPSTAKRIESIKFRYDPNNVLRNNINIVPKK